MSPPSPSPRQDTSSSVGAAGPALIARLALSAVIACGAIQAQTPAPAAADPAAASDGPAASPFSTTLAVSIASQYFFRGLQQEDRGLIAQPGLELGARLFEAEHGFLTSATLTLGIWNSLHSGPTGTRGGRDGWYESDFYIGVGVAHGGLGLGVTYTAYAYPNGAATTVEELSASLAWDDGSVWSGDLFSGLRPSALVAVELDGQADAGLGRGTYAELSINPGLSVASRSRSAGSSRPQFEVAMPVTLGLSLDDYYERGARDRTFGYLDLGLALSVPLPLPRRLGEWTVTMALDLLLLGDTTEAFNRGDDFDLVGTLGMTWKF